MANLAIKHDLFESQINEEIWKPVPSLDGVIASSWGRIKMPNRSAKMPYGGSRDYITLPTYGNKTKANKNAKHCYLGLYNKFYGNIKIHQAVCEAFHGKKPFEKAVVIHLDENALNNRPENLKWGTQKENLNMPKFIEYCQGRTGENSPTIKAMARKSMSAKMQMVNIIGTINHFEAQHG